VTHSRRDLAGLVTAFAAGTAAAQQSKLASKSYRYEDLPVRSTSENTQRAILRGELHTGFEIEMHETELAPGKAPHAPHRHVHEEMIMIREGTMEVTISGNTSKLGPGSVAFVASNEEHGWRNIGETRARYFVLALGREAA
jgi:quercetin dioxygenase-like cupin family protein